MAGSVIESQVYKLFLMMPFAEDLEWLRVQIVDAGQQADAIVERADDIFEAGIVIDQIRGRILAADAVVAVCTGRNANVFYELGIAEQEHMPVLVAEESSDLPFDVQHFRAILYGRDAADPRRLGLVPNLTRAISDTIQARRANGVFVLGQAMMHVDVVNLTRRGSYDRIAVDVVELLRQIKAYEDRREHAPLETPSIEPMLGRSWSEVQNLANEQGLMTRDLLLDDGWCISLTPKGRQLLQAIEAWYARMRNDTPR